MSRDRFVNALERAQDFYQLDRLEIGAVKVAGNLAVVDTVLYGRVVAPIQAEGKIVVQQYLTRENGKWRVATGDQGRREQRFPGLREPTDDRLVRAVDFVARLAVQAAPPCGGKVLSSAKFTKYTSCPGTGG